jgi:hypothetical protein
LRSDDNIDLISENVNIYNLGSELVTDGDMELDDSSWSDYGSPAQNVWSNDFSHGGTHSRKIVIGNQGNYAGITQSINLTTGRQYTISAWVRGSDLSAGNFVLYLGSNVFTTVITNGNWVKLEGRMVASASIMYVAVYVSTVQANANKTFYIDDVSIKDLECDLMGSGIITGNNLSPNFVPALFGIHWNASATIEYHGGTDHGLPSLITWTSPGKENVTQTITYNGNDQIISTVTQGAISGRTVTETLTWSGDDLTGYDISFS